MALLLRTKIRRFRTKGVVALGVSGALVTASMLAPASGAYFFDAREGHATSSTASFGLSVEDGNEAFNFGFDDLVPGSVHTETFTVKNTGTIAGSFGFYMQGMHVTGGSNPDVSQLHYALDGGNVTPSGSQINWQDMGELAAGQEKTYTLTASLDDAAGNEWSNTTVTSTIGMTLRQAL